VTRPALERRLGALDGALLTIGAVVGTGIFLTAGDVARSAGTPGRVLLVWLVGGLLTLAGALTYGELGAMLPRAGGPYHYLREAWGPLWGFLFGWTCLLVIMTGGIAAIAVGFGEYLGSFLPGFSSERVWTSQLGSVRWTVTGAQLAAVLAILLLTAVNHLGVRAGAGVQGALTALKFGAAIALVVAGFAIAPAADPPGGAASGVGALPAAPPASEPAASEPAASEPAASEPAASGSAALLGAFLTAMVAVLWTYDGWYAATMNAAEMRRPSRDLPLALVTGVATVIALYLLLNLVYLRTLPFAELARTTRAAEAAASRLVGETGAGWVSGAIALSAFGCLASTIVYSSRIYQPMAADGLFFRAVARIDPRWHVPVASLWLQSLWAVALTLSGTYTQLFTYVTFAGVVFHVLAGLALFRLRVTRPGMARPYRVWGYPIVPALFVAGMLALVVNTLRAAPVESMLGLAAIALGIPGYVWWRRRR
jgi:APA family basic amino acid/polyamine antiporter